MSTTRADLVVLGIDPSLTCTATAVLGPGRARAGLVKPSKVRGPARLAVLLDELRGVLEYSKPDLAVLEGYAFCAKGRQHATGEWGGLIRLELWRRQVPYLVVPPTTLKLYAAGHGRTSDLIAAVRRRWGYRTKSHDAADAFALAKLGVELTTAVAEQTTDFSDIAAACELYAPAWAPIRKVLRAQPKNGQLESKR